MISSLFENSLHISVILGTSGKNITREHVQKTLAERRGSWPGDYIFSKINMADERKKT